MFTGGQLLLVQFFILHIILCIMYGMKENTDSIHFALISGKTNKFLFSYFVGLSFVIVLILCFFLYLFVLFFRPPSVVFKNLRR